MSRLTDDDFFRKGPITIGRTTWRPWYLVLSSGSRDDDNETSSNLTAYAFGYGLRIMLPNILQPLKIKQTATYWDAATIERMGRNFYYEYFPCNYGFCLNDGHLSIKFGSDTGDSITTKYWGCFLPWTQWRFVRMSFSGLDGNEMWSGYSSYKEQHAAKDATPKRFFVCNDFDGETIQATTLIEQREWLFGDGWFKWLSIFRPRRVRRSLDIAFNKETGRKKGSWKGGTLGHGIDLLPGELHEAAFRRYCAKYGMTFIGEA